MAMLLKENIVEAFIGAAVVATAIGFVSFAYARTSAGEGNNGYSIDARFPNVTGITVGTDVRLAGIKIGTVSKQNLDPKTFQAVLSLSLDPAIKLPIDSSAAITSEGLLGGNYIALTPGGESDMLRSGDEITDTQGATDLMGLIGSVINKSGSTDKSDGTQK